MWKFKSASYSAVVLGVIFLPPEWIAKFATVSVPQMVCDFLARARFESNCTGECNPWVGIAFRGRTQVQCLRIRQTGATHVQLAGCNADCGRLEVKLHNEDAWRAVTSLNWTRADASKTCARLGFEDVASISSPPE